MATLVDQITCELQTLIGRPLGGCWRAVNMQIFEFGPRRRIRNRKGEMVEVGEIGLHIQCRWRFVDGRSILFGRDDLNYPADARIDPEEFDWDKDRSVLDVKLRAWLETHRPAPVVEAVAGDLYGGFRISLTGGFALECFPCDSRRGEYSEHWRLLRHHGDGSHFVVTGDGVEGESGSAVDG